MAFYTQSTIAVISGRTSNRVTTGKKENKKKKRKKRKKKYLEKKTNCLKNI